MPEPSEPRVLPGGTWPSPISAADAASAAVIATDPRADGADAWWVEMRPAEGGRCVLVHADARGVVRDALPAPWSARSRVHEYGGGAYAVHGGTAWFVHDGDQRVYRLDRGASAPVACTGADDGRFGDLWPDPVHGRILAVRERDAAAPGARPARSIAAVPMDPADEAPVVDLVTGHDFLAAPRPRPGGAELACVAWDHPDMPWDATRLLRVPIGPDGTPTAAPTVVAGHGHGADGESAIEPRWTPSGELLFLSDRDGHWSLYAHAPGAAGGATPVARLGVDLCPAPWKLGQCSVALLPGRGAILGVRVGARTRLVAMSVAPGRTRPETIDESWSRLLAVHASDEQALMICSASDRPTSILRLRADADAPDLLRETTPRRLDPADRSVAEHVVFDTPRGPAHAWYYPPRNAAATLPDGAPPPLLVHVHGGPTGAARLDDDLERQFWTTRGWAFVDVDHGGSAGYGRAYRERLRGAWGVVDVEDVAACARELVTRGLADPARCVITGGSAGGYTTLAALCFTDAFAAGASRFGIADLEAMADTTHDFESRYLDGLLGPLPASRDVYRDRSPIHHLDRMTRPLAVYQGAEDRVVPPAQATMIVDALRTRGVPVHFELYDGEQHGFRRESSIARTLETMDAFLRDVLAITDTPSRTPPAR